MSGDADVMALLAGSGGRGRESRPVVLATVVSTKGSTPRKTGAKMLVDKGGVVAGTIGGGCGEAEVIEAALAVLGGAPPRIVQVDLTEELTSWSPAVCGGVMDVFVERADGASLLRPPRRPPGPAGPSTGEQRRRSTPAPRPDPPG